MTHYEQYIVHELDPEGDVVLILRTPNAPLAAWVENEELLAASEPHHSSTLHQLQEYDRRGWSKKKRKKSAKDRIPSFWLLGKAIPLFWALDFGISNSDPSIPEPSNFNWPPPQPEPDPHNEPTPDDEPAPEDEPTPWGKFAHDSEAVTATDKGQEIEVRMKLSSKHLALTSMHFKKILLSPGKEGVVLSSSTYTINALECNVEPMLILMNIIHGRVRSVPRSISLEMLVQIAVIVDYYDCHEVVELFADCWIRELSHSLPEEYGRDLLLWLAVSWIFSQKALFKAMTEVAVRKSKGPVQTLGLPIPSRIVGMLIVRQDEECLTELTNSVETIDQQRQELLDRMIHGLHNLLLYSYDRTKCSFECSSMLLGALTRQMHTHGLLNPKPAKPFLGHSVDGITSTVRSFVSPKWGEPGSYSEHECTLATFLDPCVSSVVDGIEGLELEEFQFPPVQSRATSRSSGGG